MAILLANEEDLNTPGLDLFIDISSPCPMFFARREAPSVGLYPVRHLRSEISKYRST
jgi:hypothetical protein